MQSQSAPHDSQVRSSALQLLFFSLLWGSALIVGVVLLNGEAGTESARVAVDRISVSKETAGRSTISARVWQPEGEEALTKATLASQSWFSRPEAHRLLARVTRERGFSARDPEVRLELLCSSLAALVGALERDPFNADLLMLAASTRQLLATTPCLSAAANFDFIPVVTAAGILAPNDPSVQLSSGVLFQWQGDTARALQSFHRAVGLSTALTDEQYQMILSVVQSVEDFTTVVPASQPHVARWSSFLRDRRPHDFYQWRSGVAALQHQAIDHALRLYRSGGISEQLHERSLYSLLDVAAENSVRARLDAELGDFFQAHNRRAEAQYLQLRSSFESVAFIPGTLAADTRPRNTPVPQWGAERSLALDYSHQSVAAWVVDRAPVQGIELTASSAEGRLAEGEIDLFSSEDNHQFTPVVASRRITVSLDGRERVLFLFPPTRARFWKVHYTTPARLGRFRGTLRSLITLYGGSP